MEAKLVADGIYELSVDVDPFLFEGMWDIPNGVSLNSYIIKGEKTAIVDGFCGWDGVPETLIELLKSIDIEPSDIDYLVINHMEPDHSGWIENFKKLTDDFEVVCTAKAAKLMGHFYNHEHDIREVKDGDSLDLGDGHVLDFYQIPNVHWPETMMTFDKKVNALFCCDLYGTYGKLGDNLFDDELSDEELHLVYEEGLRYYSTVMSTFSTQVKKAMDKAETLPVEIIAPGHGHVWRKDPKYMMDLYKDFTEYSSNYGKKEIAIIWGSMYGMTEKAVMHAKEYIEAKGLAVRIHRMPQTPISDVMTSALVSAGIIVAAPTYEYNMFPPVAMAIEEIGRKKLSKRIAFVMGSHGWASGTKKEFESIAERYRLKWDVVEPVEFKGEIRTEGFDRIDASLDALIEKVNAL